MWAGIGLVIFVLARSFDYRWLQRLSIPITVGAGLLLVATLVPGIGLKINGSRRWLGIGSFAIQPAEFAKLAMVVFVADLLARRSRYMARADLTVRPVLVVLAAYSGLILLQPKLGTTIVLACIAFVMLYVGGARLGHLAGWGLLLVAAGGYFAYSAPYRRRRIFAFLDPFADPLNDGLQIIQSQVGIASGGLLGVGLGAGRTKWGFLPYAESDFIFALVAEEIGLLGGAGLIVAFLLLGYLGGRVAIKAPDRFGMLLAVGITTWLLLQAFLNMGMAMGLLPVTGEPLPFVSAGGSSLVSALGAAGLLTNIAKRSRL
jgi:cell division protein FtsW